MKLICTLYFLGYLFSDNREKKKIIFKKDEILSVDITKKFHDMMSFTATVASAKH